MNAQLSQEAETPDYIVVEGPIGVGKTTLANKLARSFGSDLLLEGADENPFLESIPISVFDVTRWAAQMLVNNSSWSAKYCLSKSDEFNGVTSGARFLSSEKLIRACFNFVPNIFGAKLYEINKF